MLLVDTFAVSAMFSSFDVYGTRAIALQRYHESLFLSPHVVLPVLGVHHARFLLVCYADVEAGAARFGRQVGYVCRWKS